MKLPIRIVAMLITAASVAAQGRDPREVQPERPTVATHAGTVAPGFLEFEWGAELSGQTSIAFPGYAKLGLGERSQLGLLETLSKRSAGDTGFGDFMLALKWRVLDKNPLLGDFAIQPSVLLPASSASSSQFSVLLISSHELGKLALDVNAGVTAAKGAGLKESWDVSAGAPLKGPWGWVGELSGTIASGYSTIQVLAGPTYRLHPWFSLDGGVIVPLDHGRDPSYYVGGVTNFGRIFGK